jgi:hypothetical protein
MLYLCRSGLVFDLQLVKWPATALSLFYTADDSRLSWVLVGLGQGEIIRSYHILIKM